MSVTFSGAFTFTGGGFTASLAPPSTNTAGWVAGGYDSAPTSVIQRITYATDTATASLRGFLGTVKYSLAGTGNFTDGWFAGGYTNGVGPLSTVNRITYATDTATTSVRGPLSASRYQLAATGTSTDGWFGGGTTSGSSTVERITFATDTATASLRGPLSYTTRTLCATTDSTTYGWFIAGYVPAGSIISSTVNRITYASDTGTASVRGGLTTGTYFTSGTGNTNYGWIIAGYNPANNPTSTIQRITYATDTATASVRGPLPITVIQSGAAMTDADYGWNAGGIISSALSTVNRITYATDTATATGRGPLAAANRYTAATSGSQ